MGGQKMDVVPFYRNWRENETTWQLKPKRTAAASSSFLGTARLSCLYVDFVDRLMDFFYKISGCITWEQ